MYSFARKEFVCDNCTPARTIRMLVSGDTMSVVCDQCRLQAKVKNNDLP